MAGEACAVAKGLYIGGQAALQQVEQLGITHVLSVTNYDVDPPPGACHWAVQLADDESANLIAELPGAVTWLERAMRQAGSRVLVHCNAGTSRSPSIVLAAIMKAKGLPLQQALAVLQARAPHACANAGFLAQLELWGEMGCVLDEQHPAYKAFLMEQVARQWEEEGWVDPAAFAELPEDEEMLSRLLRYRCRKCRTLLATERNAVPQAGVGRRLFRRQRRPPQQGAADDAATDDDAAGGINGSSSGLQQQQQQQQQQQEQGCVFVEPLAWMQDTVVGPVQGKLYCPHCNARLGSFNWAGLSNSSGAWVVPGFSLHLSRMDTVSPVRPAALAGMRFPAALAERKQLVVLQEQQQQDDFMPDLQALSIALHEEGQQHDMRDMCSVPHQPHNCN